MARTPAAPLRAALALLCAAAAPALLAGCSAGAPKPVWSVVTHPPTAGRPAPGASAAPLPTEPPPIRQLAVTGPATVTPAPPTAPTAPTAPGSTERRVPRTRGSHPGGRTPGRTAPRSHPGRPTLCDLAEQYGRWPVGSAQDSTCRAVYG
jgi:hypothetical protein